MKVTSLEDKALDRLYLVEDSLNEISGLCKDITNRVVGLEMINAKEQGMNEARANVSSFISDNWFRVAMLVILLIPTISWVYTNVNSVTKIQAVKGK
jgi:hypothetical protein